MSWADDYVCTGPRSLHHDEAVRLLAVVDDALQADGLGFDAARMQLLATLAVAHSNLALAEAREDG